MEIVAVELQTVAANQDVLFNAVSVSGCPSIIHRQGSGIVTLRGLARNQCRARFRVSFGANIAVPTGGTAGPIELTIAINGEGIPSSRMVSTPLDVENFNNVSADIFIDVPIGCCTQLSITNTGTTPVDVQNANMIVERVA